MRKILLFVALVCFSGCGQVGYQHSRDVANHDDRRSEIYYRIDILDFDQIWKKIK